MLSVTVYGQCSIHGENCIHYSEKQDINCLRCLINEPINDSIIVAKSKIIDIQNEFIQSSNDRMVQIDEQLSIAKSEIIEEKRKKKRNFWIACGSIGVAAVESIVIWLMIK